MSPLCSSDTNEDNFLDEQELEALFTKEVRNPQEPVRPVSSLQSSHFALFVNVFHI